MTDAKRVGNVIASALQPVLSSASDSKALAVDGVISVQDNVRFGYVLVGRDAFPTLNVAYPSPQFSRKCHEPGIRRAGKLGHA